MNINTAKITFDGGARPTNPGHAGFATHVEMGEHVAPMLCSAYIGWRTNNEAEYQGLITGLKIAAARQASGVEIYTDSKLIYGQLSQGWNVKAETLKPLFKEAMDLIEQYFGDDWKIRWVRREENGYCDNMCTLAIKHGMKNINPFSMKARGNKAVTDSYAGTVFSVPVGGSS